jgi:hypothetical protein
LTSISATTFYTQCVANQPPAAPSQVTAIFTTATSTTISLLWTAPNNNRATISAYTVYYVAQSPGTNSSVTPLSAWTVGYVGAPSQCIITSLAPSTSYAFVITALNAVNTSQPSAVVYATTGMAPPSVPVMTSVSIDASTTPYMARVTWTPSVNPTGVVLYSLQMSVDFAKAASAAGSVLAGNSSLRAWSAVAFDLNNVTCSWPVSSMFSAVYFQVSARYPGSAPSAPSAPLSAPVLPPLPPAMSVPMHNSAGNVVTLMWTLPNSVISSNADVVLVSIQKRVGYASTHYRLGNNALLVCLRSFVLAFPAISSERTR